jgi:hypothetical protein
VLFSLTPKQLLITTGVFHRVFMSDPNQQSFPPLPLSIYPDPQLIITPICLPASLPEQFASPKFGIGQRVGWSQVSSHGASRIVGLVFAQSVSVVAEGYHYAIALDEDSLSRVDCPIDWAFEDDLELVAPHIHLLHS